MGLTFSLSFLHFLSIAFLVMLLIATIYSWILIYHWRTYGQSKAITTVTTLLYLLGVAGCFIGMISAISMAA